MADMRFGHRDLWRLHAGNLLGPFFPDRETRKFEPVEDGVPLMYHGIGTTGREGLVSTLEEVLAHVRRLGSPDATPRLITFDDGYASSIPAIRRLSGEGYLVLWFVTTWSAGNAYLPKDWLRIVAERLPQSARLKVGGWSMRLHNSSPLFRRWLAFRINRAMMLGLDRRGYLGVLEALYREYRALIEERPDAGLALASVAEVKALASELPGLRLGAHGSAHYRWDRLSGGADLHDEVVAPKQFLETLVGHAVDEVAYPYGFIPEGRCLELVRSRYRRGYLAGPSRHMDDYALPRFGMDGVRTVAIGA